MTKLPTCAEVYEQLRKMFPQLPSDGVRKVVLVCDIEHATKLIVTSIAFDTVELPKEEITVFDITPRKGNQNDLHSHAEQVGAGTT